MSIRFYAYEKCSTCRKAQSLLNQKKRAYQAIDITQLPPSTEELSSMLDLVGGDVKRLFNTSGLAYRELKLSERLPTLSRDEALRLLAGNGRLIKRPFLMINGKAAAIGFKQDEWNGLL